MSNQSVERNQKVELSEAEIVYRLDLAGNFRFLNRIGERVSGYSCAEARCLNVAEIVAPEFVNYVRQQLANRPDGAYGLVFEVEILTKDGRRVALETSAQVVREYGTVSIEGIAIPKALAGGTSRIGHSRCLDADFEFGRLSQRRRQAPMWQE